MRPDEHKKKRSAQYKKKHGLTKDGEKQDGKTQKDRRSGVHSSQKLKNSIQHEKTKEIAASNSQRLTSSSSSDSEEEIKQQKTYSKRKIVSNWDRYDIPTTEEDKVEHRGEDFTKLLHSAGDAVSQFRFQDEQGWEVEDVNISVGSEFLAVDVNNLATSLDCLPLYERLGLDKNLFSEEQLIELDKVAEKNKEFYKPKESLLNTSCDSKLLSSITSVDDTLGITEDNFISDSQQLISNHSDSTDLSKLLKTKLDVCNSEKTNKTVDSSTSETKDTEIDESDSNEIGSKTVTAGIDKSMICDIDSVKDDELDFLLSLDKPADITDKGGNSQTDKSIRQNNENNVKGNVVTLETKTQEDKTNLKKAAVKSETDDLEDWLDSVLDDD